MNKPSRKILVIGIFFFVLSGLFFLLRPGTFSLFVLQVEGVGRAGTWEDDPQNWDRAFNESQPASVRVIHSKYWRSRHFTEEFTYYFEIEASPDWLRTFLKQQGFIQVAPEKAASFRANIHSSDVPDWFAPDPVGLYEVWDRPGYFGSVWINQTNGHIYFYEMQL